MSALYTPQLPIVIVFVVATTTATTATTTFVTASFIDDATVVDLNDTGSSTDCSVTAAYDAAYISARSWISPFPSASRQSRGYQVQTRGLEVSASNLSRPFLFNFFEAMVSILAFLVVWISVFGILMLWLWMRQIDYREEQIQLEPADPQPEPADSQLNAAISQLETNARMAVINFKMLTVEAAEIARKTHLQAEQDRPMLYLTGLTGFFLPLSLAVTMFNAFGTFGLTDFMSSLNWTARLPFFVPKSATGFTELDQMFSVCIGIAALFFSLWHAFKSQKRKMRELGERKEVRTSWKEV